MRLALIGTVLVLCVVSAHVPGSSPKAAKPDRREKKIRPPEPVAENPIPLVTGVGTTREEAEADALKRACDKLSEFLASEYGETRWKPSPAFLRQSGAAQVVGEPRAVSIPPNKGEKELAVEMEVRLTPEIFDQIQKQARNQRMGERQWVAARGLAGILSVLLVVFGYLKLEDVTKGYHTTLLRLTALAVLVAAGLCLWQLG